MLYRPFLATTCFYKFYIFFKPYQKSNRNYVTITERLFGEAEYNSTVTRQHKQRNSVDETRLERIVTSIKWNDTIALRSKD
jgi:hypothetical protein